MTATCFGVGPLIMTALIGVGVGVMLGIGIVGAIAVAGLAGVGRR